MAKNASLNKASKAKEDEFYTQLPDIEAEMRHYKDHFQGKVVLCNCDDPYESNFFKYFAMNFNFLGLKKLIATSYVDSPIAGVQLPLFDAKSIADKNPDDKCAFKIEISEVRDENADGAVDLADVERLLRNGNNALTRLQGDGDFRSPECIELLKQADIVVTNPPFSLFREYVSQLIENNKKFIIIGNKNAITYDEIFRLIQKQNLWLGYRNINQDMWFIVPEHYKCEKVVDGIRLKHIMGCWFTNLDFDKRHETLTLYSNYKPDEYPFYANYDAIEVSKVSEIPYDYACEMGVPLTFLDKFNPDQFDIIGSSRFLGKPIAEIAPKGTFVSGGMSFYLSKGDGTYKRLYFRIVIKRKGTGQPT
jgi:hypothetical protein